LLNEAAARQSEAKTPLKLPLILQSLRSIYHECRTTISRQLSL